MLYSPMVEAQKSVKLVGNNNLFLGLCFCMNSAKGLYEFFYCRGTSSISRLQLSGGAAPCRALKTQPVGAVAEWLKSTIQALAEQL